MNSGLGPFHPYLPADGGRDFHPVNLFWKRESGSWWKLTRIFFFWKIENPRFFKQQSQLIEIILLATSQCFFFPVMIWVSAGTKLQAKEVRKKIRWSCQDPFHEKSQVFFSLFWWQRFQQTKHPWSLTANSPPKKRVIDWKMILSFDMKRHFLTFPIEYVKLRGCMKMNMSVLVLKMKEFFALPWIFFSDPRTRYKPWVRWLLSQN